MGMSIAHMKAGSGTTNGWIIITTRQPDRVNGEKIKVQSMVKEEESLRILATRSGRDNMISGKSTSQEGVSV
jgi:hypothetical protein